MSENLIFGLYIFALATFVGYQVISRVPPLLHTPLMSGTNAISGISLVGSLVAAGAKHDLISNILGCIAVTAATTNVVGGFMITDRMLRMFRKGPAGPAGSPGRPKTQDQGRLTMRDPIISVAYLVSSILFILALRGLSSPEQGRRGVFLAEIGMLIAVLATLVKREIVSYEWIAAGLLMGALIGTAISLRIPMTKMPERIAFSHAFGGLATALVGVVEFHKLRGLLGPALLPTAHDTSRLTIGALGCEVFLGSLTFTGSIIAFGKLQGMITGAPVTWKGQNFLNIGAFFGTLALVAYQIAVPNGAPAWMFLVVCGAGLLLGILGVLPIGGADMPVVISLLNSYAGLAACATGFALQSNILIIAGALDGSSGLLLSIIMSRAMNRSFANVVFGAFGA